MSFKASERVIEWLSLTPEDRKELDEYPVAFIQLQNHVLVTDDEMIIFEADGVGLQDADVLWAPCDQFVPVEQGEFDFSSLYMTAAPFGFTHTDIVVCWDENLEPHYLIISRPNYAYFFSVDINFPELVSLQRQRIDVEKQPPIDLKDEDGFSLQVQPSENFFELTRAIMDQSPNLIYQELSKSELAEYEELLQSFQQLAESV